MRGKTEVAEVKPTIKEQLIASRAEAKKKEFIGNSPLYQELSQWYDMNPKSITTATRIVVRLREMRETPERVRDFLLARDKKPPLQFFLDDFLDWQQRNPASTKPLTKKEYKEYIAGEQWKRRRDVHIRQAEGKCQLCNSDNRLHVHHRTYDRLGCERFTDLIVLCNDCHGRFHGKITGNLPKVYEMFDADEDAKPKTEPTPTPEWYARYKAEQDEAKHLMQMIEAAGIRQGKSAYAGEVAILCHVCGNNCVHPIEAAIWPFEGGDYEGKKIIISNSGVSVGDVNYTSSCRGVRIVITFRCESGHVFEHTMAFHKGHTHLQATELDKASFTEHRPIWRN